MMTLKDKFYAHLNIPKGHPCWEWEGALRGSKTSIGHGVLYHEGQTHIAHRVAYELFIGPIPPGAAVRHTCRYSWCVNPEHLTISSV